MSYTTEYIDEVNVLMLFDVSNHQEGIKVHKEAGEDAVKATMRLFKKGLVTQEDGGYLTDLGLEASEHAQSLFMMMSSN